MIIMDQGVAVTIPDDAEWLKKSNGGGNCVEVTPVALPVAHPKHGRGKAVALRDSQNPSGPVLIFTDAELRSFAAGVGTGHFDGMI